MSPYSVKVRSYFRYKAIPHEWIARRADNEADYKKYAKLPIVPTVVTPLDEAVQDSTPIIERVEAEHPDPSIHPQNESLAFLSALIEEFGDEWGNKIMFHYRWWSEIDQLASAQTLARLNRPNASGEDVAMLAKAIRERMTGRGHFVGSSAQTAPLIEGYFYELLDILEPHLQTRKYLFGERPSFGDFGLSAQLYEASVDPTCGSVIRARAPAVLDWCHRMLEPRPDGPFASWNELKPTLQPLVAYIGRYFLPWSQANADALAAGDSSFTVNLAGKAYTQPPQKYHAKSLAALKAKYRALPANAMDAVFDGTGCPRYLA
jgi:glutathione S-transferase